MAHAFYAIGLNLHQPHGNLIDLINNQNWEAKQIMEAYERIPRYVKQNWDARLHVDFSGTLLMQLADPGVRETFQHTMNIEWLMNEFRTANIEFLGSGYTHPVFPLIPQKDWDTQIGRYLDMARNILGRDWFPGFWPPEMGFCMEMIPYLKKFGYRYVVVDIEHIEANDPMSWEKHRYRPHVARYDGHEIIVVPRDRELSSAQLSGCDPGWFAYELGERTQHCHDFPALVTCYTDGENGGWFRNPYEKSNFWGWFYEPILHWQREGTLALTQISINEYLDKFGWEGEVIVHSGAWNTDHHDGRGFVQWTGSLLQKKGIEELKRISEDYHNKRWRHSNNGNDQEGHDILDKAYWHILRAETSCNFYWGSRWVYKAFDDLEEAERIMNVIP